jgi:exodeoxyribonuclease V gamma subunit
MRFDPVEDATARLQELLGCYEAGLQCPLPFFPSTSEAYVRANIAGKSRREAVAAARRRWQSDFGHSESNDPYYRCCFGDRDPLDDEFCNIAETVWVPLLACAAPLPG